MISIKDVMRVGHLMAEYIARLDENSLDSIKWED